MISSSESPPHPPPPLPPPRPAPPPELPLEQPARTPSPNAMRNLIHCKVGLLGGPGYRRAPKTRSSRNPDSGGRGEIGWLRSSRTHPFRNESPAPPPMRTFVLPSESTRPACPASRKKTGRTTRRHGLRSACTAQKASP